MKRFYQIIALLLAVLILAGLSPLRTAADTNNHTQADAVAWIRSQEGQSLDYDNAYGAQCVDLTKYYYVYLGQGQPFGDACEYAYGGALLPDGWTYQSVPQPGDIAVDASYYPGHVALVLEAANGILVCLDQNYGGNSYCEKIYRNLYSHGFTTFIRPDFSSAAVYPDGWHWIGGAWYYYKNYQAVKGWLYDRGCWYYLDPSIGEMKTGWVFYNGSWYYMNASGAMQTGWQWIGGNWYYLYPYGNMAAGWLCLDGSWYYLNASGAMQTGWQKIGDYWYYFKADGTMAVSEWWGGYCFSESGAWLYEPAGSWTYDDAGWRFEASDGWYAKSETLRINGETYAFDENGYWIENPQEDTAEETLEEQP